MDDMSGMRHLYYQRIYVTLARQLGIDAAVMRRTLSIQELETIRHRICDALSPSSAPRLAFNCSLWGWNFGFDYAPTGYRLHASHQQIHQQYAMLPAQVAQESPTGGTPGEIPSFACGDLVQDFSQAYNRETGRHFFDTYIRAIRSNRRMDGRRQGPQSLIVYEDAQVMVFVPKAQTSQWELQLMTLKPVGSILEADTETRRSLDRALLAAVKALSGLGARMITHIEYAKRFDAKDTDQRLPVRVPPTTARISRCIQ
jgi:hypothetical protein